MTKAGLQQQGNSKGLGELWARLRFVFIALVIYRIGAHIQSLELTLIACLNYLDKTKEQLLVCLTCFPVARWSV